MSPNITHPAAALALRMVGAGLFSAALLAGFATQAQTAQPDPRSTAPVASASGNPPTTAVAAKAPDSKPAEKPSDSTKAELTKLPKPANLRPNGPVTVTAKRAELVQGSSAVYTGNVVMDSDTLKLDGDRLELKQYTDSQYEAKLTGGPAHMSHPSTGPDDPPMTARAKTITYDSRNGVADLVGDAIVTKGDQKISADTIHYNVAENGIQANGGDGGQVKIVIPPAPPPGGGQ